jgi:hypothetical protein
MKKNTLLMALFMLTFGVSNAWGADATIAAGENSLLCTVNGAAGVKVGSSKKAGKMTITVPAGALKLNFYAAAWNKVNGSSLTISPADKVSVATLNLTADSGIQGTSTDYTLAGTESSYSFELGLQNVTEETVLTLTSEKRFVIWNVTYSAEASEDEETPDTPTEPETPDTPTEPENPDTPTEPETPDTTGVITCAEAVVICEATGSTATADDYKVRGYVTEIKYAWSEKYGTATFWIADTKDGGKVLQAYSCAPLSETDRVFDLGAYVELVGKLKKYNDTNEVERGTYTILVAGEGGETEDPETPDTPTEPETPDTTGVITCAEALAICLETDTISTTESYTIRGYVTELKEAYNSQYKNTTFWMADSVNGGQVLLAFRVKPVVEADQNCKVGDYVEVVGTLINYKGDTPEVNAGGSYTILVAGEGGETEDPETPETPDVETKGDGTEANPFTVEDVIALNNTLTGKHYVVAYIVGQATGASFVDGLDMEAPFEAAADATQGTNLAIASSMSADTANIIPVQLPKGELRDEFNLVENPGMYGKQVVIYGELVRYFSLPGIKNPESIEVVGATGDDDPTTGTAITGLQYADAVYVADEEYGDYWIFDLYKDWNEEANDYVYPDLYIMVNEAFGKTTLNGTYNVLYAEYLPNANDEITSDEAAEDFVGTLTIKNTDNEGNYSFKGSFVDAEGNTYTYNQVVNVAAYEYIYDEATGAEDYKDITLSESGNTDDPDTPSSMITCAQAATIAAAENYKGTENVTVYGYVVELGNQKTDDKTGRLKQCFYLSDNKGGEKQFMAYWAFVPEFFEVDDKVAVTGILQNYQGTIEIADGEAKLLDDTAVDDVFVENIPVKVVKNGQLYIITGDKVYNVLGTQVK